MFQLVAKWIINALALYIVSRIVEGVTLTDFKAALVAALIIGLINTLIKPVFFFLTLPINIMTLGLFTFVLNALLLMIAGSIAPGFSIDGFGAALIGSIVLSVVTMLLNSLVR